MSQQIQISGGAKVRDLQDVIIGTSGVLSSLAFNVANGVPKLDVNGKILVSQLPNSVMEYKGVWNAATNTPTLANGTGNQGDVYLCNVAGTTNFGAGPIAFVVGDQVIYSSVAEGSIWQRASGATGTVTSVALTESGDSLNITGSPITTSGTINIGFNGTNLQYVNGAGNLTTFPILTGYVPYTGATQDVDLGAFSLNGKSLHIKGTAGNGHLGLKHQSAAATGNANESLIYADSLGDLGWQNANLYLSKFITSANTANRSYTFPNATGTIALTSDISYPVTSVFGRTGAVVATSGDYTTTQVTEGTNLYYTDTRARLALSFVAGSGAYNSTTGVITIPTNNNQITNGAAYITLTSLSAGTGISYNNTTGVITNSAPDQTVSLTAGAGISVSGTYPSFTIASTITQYTDALARAAISLTTTGTSGAATYNNTTGVLNIPQYTDQFVGTVTSVAALTIGTSGTDLSSSVANSTTTPVITLNVPTASATNRGALSSADWTTFNNKQSALTNPITGTGTSNLIAKFNGSTTLTNSLIEDNGSVVGINGAVATHIFQIYSGTTNYARVGITNTSTGNTFGDGLIFQQETINSIIKNQENGYLAFGVNGSETNLVIAQGGKVGIGTASPQSTFVVGVTADTQGCEIDNATSGVPRIFAFNRSGGVSLPLALQSVGGNVLIGTTTDAGYKLDVNGTGRFTGNLRVRGGTNFGGYYMDYQSDATSRSFRVSSEHLVFGDFVIQRSTTRTGTTYEDLLYFDANRAATFSSSVTAGGTSSGANFNAYSSSYGNNGLFQSFGTDGNLKLQMGGLGNSEAFFYTGGYMTFYTGGSEKVRITSGGNVLIGTTTDSGYKLDVNGTGRFSGVLEINSGNINTGNNLSLAWNSTSGASIQSFNSKPLNINPLGNAINFGGAATFSSSVTAGGNISIVKATPGLILSGTSYGNSGAYIQLLGWAASNYNWQVSLATEGDGNLHFIPSTAVGGSTFTTPVISFSGTGAITASSFFESSDSRLKTLIQDNYQTKGIASITPKLYTKNGKVELGYYAQDFVGILDSAISKDSDNMLSLSYREVHTAKIYALEQEIKELKAKMN